MIAALLVMSSVVDVTLVGSVDWSVTSAVGDVLGDVPEDVSGEVAE